MSSQSEFLQQIKDALKHLYDHRYLEDHPLALQYWPEAGRTGGSIRAQRLSRLLLESIEELHPPTAISKNTPYARAYHLLVYRYVEEWALPDIMREMGYSRRQFFREQRKAIAMLASLLQEKLSRQAILSTEPGNLLDVEAERVLAQREAVDLSEVVQGVLEVVSGLAEQHGVELERDLGSRLAPIHGGRTLLRQVFLKALSALITWPGAKRVLLKMYCDSQRVIIELMTESSTLGFRPDAVGGHHMPDLDSVRRLVEIAGGHWQGVQVEPRSCTCGFGFPVESQKVLLVIEDNEAVIRAFRRFLISRSYQVIGVSTGAEVLRLAREVRPTAITLDVLMPIQDGWEILQALKSDPATRQIPVIICSVLEDPELAHSLGAVAYLRKPVSQTELLAVLDTLSCAS